LNMVCLRPGEPSFGRHQSCVAATGSAWIIGDTPMPRERAWLHDNLSGLLHELRDSFHSGGLNRQFVIGCPALVSEGRIRLLSEARSMACVDYTTND
jgi:hypothetical protein